MGSERGAGEGVAGGGGLRGLFAGGTLCDNDVVEMVIREAPERIQELIDWGTHFDEQAGRILLGREGGHSHNRIVHALGDMTGAAGRNDEAAEWFRKASLSDPYWGKPLYRLGLSAMNGGDTSAAAKYMEQVIRVDPASPEATLARTALNQLNK